MREFHEITANLLSLDEFYVYAMIDGSHRVEASYSGEVAMSFYVALASDEDDWEISRTTGRVEYLPGYYRAADSHFELVEGAVMLRVAVDATLNKGQLIRWEIINIEES